MIIEVPKIPVEGTRFEGDEPAAMLDLGGNKHLRATQPVRYQFDVEIVTNELIVRGEISTEVEFECGKCAEFFSTTIGDSSFLRSYDISGKVETVDVTPDIREAVLLALPSYPICRPECAGLCPRCGKNLNAGSCACPPEAGENRWGTLDGLKLS